MESRQGRRQAVRASTLPDRDRKATTLTVTPADRLLDRLVPLVDEALDNLLEQTPGAEELQLPDEVDDLDDLVGVASDWVNQIAMGGDQDWADLRDLFSHSTEVLLLCLKLARYEHRYDVMADASKLALRAYEAFADQMVDAEEAADLKQIIPYWKMKRLVADYEAKRARRSRVEKAGKQSSRSRRWGSSNVVVLFWAASPLHQERILFDDEKNALQGLLGRSKVDIKDRLAARPDQLSQSIWEHKPDIVHFSGHGRDGLLAFQGEDGVTAEVSLEQIADLFRRAVGSHGGENLRCVVLNACYSADIAEAIAEHVDCVIGTPTAIEDVDAIEFSKGFYEGISWSQSVQVAFGEGCARIARSAPKGTVLPELKVRRPGVDPDGIWFLKRIADRAR